MVVVSKNLIRKAGAIKAAIMGKGRKKKDPSAKKEELKAGIRSNTVVPKQGSSMARQAYMEMIEKEIESQKPKRRKKK